MNDPKRLAMRIGGSILLVVVVYFAFSFIIAYLVNHEPYVFEWQDLVVPLVLGLVAEFMDIRRLIDLLRKG